MSLFKKLSVGNDDLFLCEKDYKRTYLRERFQTVFVILSSFELLRGGGGLTMSAKKLRKQHKKVFLVGSFGH